MGGRQSASPADADQDETIAPAPGSNQIKPSASQMEAIRRLRERTESGPVPPHLERRSLRVGDMDRECFIHVPAAVKVKPAPVVFALHGGASSSGLAMHFKADFTKLGDAEGYVTVYPSGVNGWNLGSHDMDSVQRRTSNADDIGFFRAMFDTLIAENDCRSAAHLRDGWKSWRCHDSASCLSARGPDRGCGRGSRHAPACGRNELAETLTAGPDPGPSRYGRPDEALERQPRPDECG